MSTRSGKRIHSSFLENTLKPDLEHVAHSDRKTRNRRLKENIEELNVCVVKSKKRSNYVSYPTDDDVGSELGSNQEEEVKPTRSLRKNALKELSNVTSSTESSELPFDLPKPVRTTRRTCKFPENIEDEPTNHVEQVRILGTTKKEKKKKKSNSEDVKAVTSKKKLKKKSKKGKRSGSMVVEDIVPEKNEKETLNKSNMSMESFHSAAGSPLKGPEDKLTNNMTSPLKVMVATSPKSEQQPEGRLTRSAARLSSVNLTQNPIEILEKVSRKRKSSFKDDLNAESQEIADTLTNAAKKRKSNIIDIKSKKNSEVSFEQIKNSTFNLEDLEKRKSAIKAVINSTLENLDFTLNKELGENTTYEKEQPANNNTPQSISKSLKDITMSPSNKITLNTTYEQNDKPLDSAQTAMINTTYEKNPDNNIEQVSKEWRSSLINATCNKDAVPIDILSQTDKLRLSTIEKSTPKQSTELNSTYDKTPKCDLTFEKDKNRNSTFDKDKKLDTTFDKDKKLDTPFDKTSKSSLISSDNSNVTLDKSDISRISITSDDSKENIVNTTPVLIESSIDESLSNSSKNPIIDNSLNVSKQKSPSEISKTSPSTTPLTPLKREGTFTKDGSDISLPKTPIRKMSLPSPGCTPFPKSGGKPSVMNVTRSLEKSRRSSLAEPLPRTTRVMFCSPINNPVLVAQQRKKVIKSSLKGSNKSFVFEEGAEPRAAPRKRSYTHSGADEARAKRNRLERSSSLGRPGTRARAASATAKLPEPGTPSKRPTTPRKEPKLPRTKLPNFAALHQREFDKMESLDECQQRKARRARQLLTPTGAVTVLERTSPKDATEPSKAEEARKSPALKEDKDKKQSQCLTETKKPATPIKSLPTLKSLNPGYTRFGFKLNYDVNPFTVNSKNDRNVSQVFSNKKNTVKRDFTRPLKEIKGLKRQATLPSMKGATSAKEAAKLTVMREKSFTDKRDKTRTENRTVIKGVRTNRRFELQMRMRNVE